MPHLSPHLTVNCSTTAANVVGRYHDAMEKMEFNTALAEIWVLVFLVQTNTLMKQNHGY